MDTLKILKYFFSIDTNFYELRIIIQLLLI